MLLKKNTQQNPISSTCQKLKAKYLKPTLFKQFGNCGQALLHKMLKDIKGLHYAKAF